MLLVWVISSFADSTAGIITQSQFQTASFVQSDINIIAHPHAVGRHYTKKQTMNSLARAVSFLSKNISPQFTALTYK